jgi:hypothetical protein
MSTETEQTSDQIEREWTELAKTLELDPDDYHNRLLVFLGAQILYKLGVEKAGGKTDAQAITNWYRLKRELERFMLINF